MPKLIRCSACGGTVSIAAIACPACGHPIAAEKKAKSTASGCLFTVILLLGGLVWLLAKYAGDGTERPAPTVRAAPNPVATAPATANTGNAAAHGTGLSKTKLIDAMQKGADPFEFEKVEAGGADDVYVGSSNHSLIRLIGPPDNLTEASFTAPVTTPSRNLIAFAQLIGFAHNIDPEAGEWVVREMKGFAETPKTDYENVALINGRKLLLTFSGKHVSFIVTGHDVDAVP